MRTRTRAVKRGVAWRGVAETGDRGTPTTRIFGIAPLPPPPHTGPH